MKLDRDLVVAGGAEDALGEADLALVDLDAALGDDLGDVAGANGTEQLAFIAGQGLDGELADLLELGGAILRSLQLAGDLGLELGALGLELLEVLLGGADSLLVGKEEIAGEAVLDLDLVAQTA